MDSNLRQQSDLNFTQETIQYNRFQHSIDDADVLNFMINYQSWHEQNVIPTSAAAAAVYCVFSITIESMLTATIVK